MSVIEFPLSSQGQMPSTQHPVIPITPIPASKEAAPRRTRYKLWELQDCWHCMVVGTCLTLAEVRQAASKAGVSIAQLSDFDVHQRVVECAADKSSALTLRIQKLLERKFALHIKRFKAAKDKETLNQLWDTSWRSGQVAGGLWALITHPLATRDVVMEMFGQVHMMSHLSGASTCVDRERLVDQERIIASLTAERDTLTTRCNGLRLQLSETQAECSAERKVIQQLKAASLETEKKAQRVSVQPAEKVAKTRDVIDQLRQKTLELQQALSEERLVNQQQVAEIVQLNKRLDTFPPPPPCDAESLKLCGQCVLYLGGKNQQRRHFQSLVESCEGRFLHHDGGREVCPHRISELVNQADVVMCPTDCISHGAMEKARALCAKQDKPIVFMQRASLSTFKRSLQEAFG